MMGHYIKTFSTLRSGHQPLPLGSNNQIQRSAQTAPIAGRYRPHRARYLNLTQLFFCLFPPFHTL